MAPKKITVCQDETFHPQACLVAMEPVSNFLLVEQYADKVDAAHWNQAMNRALSGLQVEVVQCTSDEGQGLLRYAREHLGVHHSPDLFHPMQDLSRSTSSALASKVLAAEKAVEKAVKCNGRVPSPTTPAASPKGSQSTALQSLENAQARQRDARALRKAFSHAYHPFDLDSGKSKSPEQLEGQLRGTLVRLLEIAQDAGLASVHGLHKAWRLIPQMVATVAFFHQQLRLRIEALGLCPAMERLVYTHWLPGLYLLVACRKASGAKERKTLKERAQALLAPIYARYGPLADSSEEHYETIQQALREGIALFQRSSSCVEGRNGQLSLRHHGRHRFCKRTLGALTVVHNYFLRRSDGTTTAERFFAQQPADLFASLLDTLEVPRRPSRPRSPRRLAMAA